MDNRRAGALATFLGSTSLVLVLLAIYANTIELPATPSSSVGVVTGLLAVAGIALVCLMGRELGRRGSPPSCSEGGVRDEAGKEQRA